MSSPTDRLRVVLIASEAVPFSKTGGLADVVGALPRALGGLGVEVSLIVPCHRSSWDAASLEPTGISLCVPIGSRIREARLLRARIPQTDAWAYLVDRPESFDRPKLYGDGLGDYLDNCERFTFFARTALEAVRKLDLRPHVLHCNDWQTGLIPVYLRESYDGDGPTWRRMGVLTTIHNLAYQGRFWHFDLPLTGLPWSLFHWQALEAFGHLNFLKAGLVYSDLISTVSPTYAREIQTPEFGCGLDGLLRHRAHDLRGIVNGIDTTQWNPALDPLIARNYTVETALAGKAACKAQLQRRAALPERPDVPLIGAIGRLDPQKGWDLLNGTIDWLLAQEVQLVVLGEGQAHYHEHLDQLAARYGEKLRVFLRFSNELAHQIEAGSDLFLMPSLYEPCGLNQLYSQAYGTIPVVRATGGLADTVVDVTPWSLESGRATGVVFHEPSVEALREAIGRALDLWTNRSVWNRLVEAGMRQDWSWTPRAREYLQLYEEIRDRRAGR